MQDYLREWRQDALHKNQYDTALYVGDKVLAITNDPQDALFLARVHFSTGNYTRAYNSLEIHNLTNHNPACRYFAAHCQIKQNKYEDALTLLGDKNPTHLISTPSKARRKLFHRSLSDRSATAGVGGVTAASQTRTTLSSRHDARVNHVDPDAERQFEAREDVKHEAGMCFLRGTCYAKQNAFDRAKECYKDAVRIDVQCFEAFEQLMKNKLMSPDEEWEFLQELDFDSILSPEGDVRNSPAGTDASDSRRQEASQFTKMLYTTLLSKYKNPGAFAEASETLSTHYGLANNADLLLSKAELYFTQCRFKQALAISATVLESDPYNFAILPIHLASLNELGKTNELFLLSHRLADAYPDEAISWLAVGIYYLSIAQFSESRRYFSKASMMDPHFGPAWIGFAHTFAAEGEHDQAISAYSTAARLFQGTHLPQLFLGMQNVALGNMTLAHEFLSAAHKLCATDPLLLNELGVVFYNLDQQEEAIGLFKQALQIAEAVESEPKAWIATRANLAHAYRRCGNHAAALNEFDDVLRYGGRSGSIFSAKGLVLLELGRPWEAVCAFHEALSKSPQDPIATDLLARALEENAVHQGWQDENDHHPHQDQDQDNPYHPPGGIAPTSTSTDQFDALISKAKRDAHYRNRRNLAFDTPHGSRGIGSHSSPSHASKMGTGTGMGLGTHQPGKGKGRIVDERGSIGAVGQVEEDSTMMISDEESVTGP